MLCLLPIMEEGYMFDLRDYQFDAVNAVMRDMSEVQKVGLVLPTGAGVRHGSFQARDIADGRTGTRGVRPARPGNGRGEADEVQVDRSNDDDGAGHRQSPFICESGQDRY